jgi:hypothetical protein
MEVPDGGNKSTAREPLTPGARLDVEEAPRWAHPGAPLLSADLWFENNEDAAREGGRRRLRECRLPPLEEGASDRREGSGRLFVLAASRELTSMNLATIVPTRCALRVRRPSPNHADFCPDGLSEVVHRGAPTLGVQTERYL